MRPGFLLRVARRVAANRARRWLGRPAIPYKVLWNTTYYCNSRCRSCNVWQIYPDEGSQAGEIQRDEVGRTLSSLGPDLLWLTMTGGEPTLKLHLAETVSDVYDACPNLGFISVNTNAIIPEQTVKVMRQIAEHCRRAEVLAVLSLDGVGEVHDRIRGVDGNFEAVMETRRQILALGDEVPNLGLCIQSTVSEHNLDHVDDLMGFCRKNGDEHLLTFAQEAELYRNYGDGHDVASTLALPTALRAIARAYRPRRLRDLVQWFHLRLLRHHAATGRAPVPCGAGSSTLTLGPRGDVSGCLFLDNVIGHARDFDHDLRRLVNSEKGRAVQAACRSCDACWTNCESFTSMLSSPVVTLIRALGSRPSELAAEPAGGELVAPRADARRT